MELPKRKPTRLKDYDYSAPGAYFVTICTKHKEHLFGKKYDIPNIVGKFKAAVTRNVGNAFMHSVKNRLWQSSFHDHIICGDEDYNTIWEYINTNALKWEQDCFYVKEMRDIDF